jgi:integrase
MAHIKVPHTITRGGFYYLNLRKNKLILRLSLRTTSSYTALTIINTIIQSGSDKEELLNMSHKEIVDMIERVRDSLKVNSIALLDIESREAEKANEAFKLYHSNATYKHSMFDSATVYGVSEYTQSFEPKSIKTLINFKLDRLYDLEQTPQLYAKSSCRSLASNIIDNDDSVVDQHDLSFKLAVTEEKLELLYEQAFELRKLIEKGARIEAKELLDSIVGIPKVQNQNIIPEENLKPLSLYMDEFLLAGKEGKLSPVNGIKRLPWNLKIYEDNVRIATVISLHLGDVPLNKVDGRELDNLFRDVIENMPLSHKSPFNKMNWQERYTEAVAGNVDDDVRISGSSIGSYKKILQSFFRYILDMHYLDLNPMDKMRRTVSTAKKPRGAFSNKETQEIVNFCKKQADTNKKWPVILMAFMGMRNGEVMQLRKEDVRQCDETGISYILITDKAGSIKNLSSIRKVPIHRKIIELGFLKFVDKARTKLFNESSKYLTRFYANTLKVALNLPEETETNKPLSLYSLRHFVATELTSNGVNETTTQQIIGHQKKTDTLTKFYLDTIKLESLQKAINEVNLI